MISVEIKSLLRRLNRHCTRSVEAAAGMCVSRQHYEVTVEHTLLQMLDEPGCDVNDILRHYGVDASRLRKALAHSLDALAGGNAGRPVFSPLLLEWLQEGWLIGSLELHQPAIRSGALLLALVTRPERFTGGDWVEILESVSVEDLRKRILEICTGSVEDEAPATTPGAAPGATAPRPGAAAADGALAQYCTDFTARAREGAIDPVFGRDREIRQMADILARRRKNNPIIVGEAGVGKTALVEGLALLVVKGELPAALRDVQILGLDLGLLQAGASVKGEFENRLKTVIQEVKASPKPIILFIDEAHTMIGAGGAPGGSDAANLLKPALARGELRTIAATTWSEYKKYFEKDPALARRFQPVKLEEPSEEDTILMLRGLRDMYEKAHGVRILDAGLVASARLASRYISGRQLPDKAVDLLDTAAARVKIGLASRPAALDDLQRRREAIEREQRARARDRASGIAADAQTDSEVEAELARALQEVNDEFARVETRWKREQAVAERVVELRDRLEGKSPNGRPGAAAEGAVAGGAAGESMAGATSADGAEAERLLANSLQPALAELREVQGKDALVHVDVNPEVVAQVVSDWTGIPVGKMVRDEAATILGFDAALTKRIKGQDHAVAAIAQGIRAAKAGLGNPRSPMGVFLFVGPSGVGKTETALGVADLLFGGERFVITINMSEFQEKHTVSRLIGSPPGYVGFGEGGVLTEAVRQRPYSVVLLDEVEKADPEVMNLFYQVFDKGMLSDGEGRVIDFKNTIVFLTSNLASDIVLQLATASPRPGSDDVITAIRPTLNKHFKPALVARMTIVPYFPISEEAMRDIVQLKLDRIGRRLRESHRIAFDADAAVAEQVAQRCKEVETGARNIDHILSGTLLPRIATEILQRMGDGGLPRRLHLSLDGAGDFQLEFA